MPLSFENTEVAFQYRSNKQLKKAHFLFKSMGSSFLTRTGIKLTDFALKFHLPIKGLIKSTIFEQFCGGENIQEAGRRASLLGRYKVTVALDYGVEGKENEEDYDHAVPEFVKAIEYAAGQKNIPFIPIKITGFANFSLLEKLHENKDLSDSEVKAWQRVKQRIDTICATAAKNKICILIDAEETWIQKPIDELANRMMELYNKDTCYIFNTYQHYCTHRLDDMKKDYAQALEKGYHFGCKIVRGAYMEKERARAAEKNYPSPINPTKEATDEKYNQALEFCLEHLGVLSLYMGTHNEDSCLKAVHILEAKGIAPSNPYVYFAQLFGMSDNMTFNLANAGYHANKYLPYGPVQDVIPYLMRRAQENTSVKGQTGRELFLIQKEMKRRGI